MKRTTAILAAALMLTAFTGCGKDAASDSSDTTKPATTETVTETDAEPSSEPVSETNDFDFERAVNDTYICGQKLTYPIKWSEFSGDFTVVSEGSFSDAERNKISCFVNYKGQEIGTFIFTGTATVEGITPDTEIRLIDVRVNPEITDVPVYSFRGLEFHGKKDDVTKLLGEPDSIGPNDSAYTYNKVNGDTKQIYRFSFGTLGEDDFDGIYIIY
ncbi:MAG: hypothetical protein IKO47_00370 [Ruminococcus sp.]|nr:hypothetical protein [Ruminococcus sp.]